MQTLYNFTRTTCACDACKDKCRHLSGMAVPEDLLTWKRIHGDNFILWALASLAASPGALVLRGNAVFSIQTIVPARLATGACYFLTATEQCRIHATAPFGCAYFDHAMPDAEGNLRSSTALQAILADWEKSGPYSRLWLLLHDAGKQAEAPELARQRLKHP